MMNAAEPEGTRWIVVTTETDLRAALPAFSPAGSGADPDIRLDDPEEDPENCLDAAFSAVRSEAPVALLLSDSGRPVKTRFPFTGRVTRLWSDNGTLLFSLESSEVVFEVSSDQTELHAAVSSAYDDPQAELLVLDPAYDGRVALVQPWSRRKPRICDSFDLDPKMLTVLSKTEANGFYDGIFALNSQRPYTRGIPFRLSYAYCEAKAEAVKELLRADRVVAGKVWMFAKHKDVLRVRTTSRKSCRERWSHHVAVVVGSDSSDGSDFWVFDPTLSVGAGVFSYQEWVGCFGASKGPVFFTTGDAYILCGKPDGPPFQRVLSKGENATALTIARCLLRSLAHGEGHPPFRC